MNRQPWTLEYRRYVVALRTMLAHPAGSNPWFQIPQVLDEITEVYPGVWAHAEKVDSNNATFRSFLIRGKRSSPLKDRCPTKSYQVLIAPVRELQTIPESNPVWKSSVGFDSYPWGIVDAL